MAALSTNQCVRTIPDSLTATTKSPASQDNISAVAIITTILVHEAWIVTWAESDRSTLTPSLPDLTNGMTLPTWTPGDKIPNGEYDDTASREKKLGVGCKEQPFDTYPRARRWGNIIFDIGRRDDMLHVYNERTKEE